MTPSSSTWSNMEHWDLLLPPSRPSQRELRIVSSLAKGVPSGKPIGILGSTPEFRDLLYELGCSNVHAFERNMDFFSATSRLRVYDNTEHVIEGDWLTTLPAHSNSFSLIVSDLTMGNVPYGDRRRFYDAVSNSLSVGGVFYDKVLTHPGRLISLDTIGRKYRDLPLNLLTVNHFSCEALFCSELLDDSEVVDTSAFYDTLSQTLKHPRIDALIARSRLITPDGCTWYYGRRWSFLDSGYCPRLTRLAVVDDEPTSPYAGRLKLFTLARG